MARHYAWGDYFWPNPSRAASCELVKALRLVQVGSSQCGFSS